MSQPPRILYLSYDGLTDPLGQSQILPYLTALSSGYAFSIISFEKRNRFREERERVSQICREHGIDWYPLIYHKSPPVLSTLFDLWNLRRVVKRLQSSAGFKIVHCRSYITAITGMWMKRRYDIKFIFDMRGFWADERVEGALWNLGNPVYQQIYSYFKRKEMEFIRGADRIVALTDNAKREILTWSPEANATVIPCCVDMTLFDPGKVLDTKVNLIRKELGIQPDDFVLLYLGSWGTWYLTQEMLAFFSHIKSSHQQARFLVVTPDHPDFSEHEHQKDIIIRRALREEVPAWIRLATAGICFIKPSFSKKASSATKVGEMLAMGIPVISNAGWGDVSDYVATLAGFVSVNGKKDYSNGLAQLLRNQGNPEVREGVSKVLSLDRGVSLYRSIYESLM